MSATVKGLLRHLGGVPVTSGQDISGSTYFVDGNSGNDANNGSSWENAFKTLAVAFAASHADIARGADRWARRNTIYIAGDSFAEDLIIFPQKTDVIGVGSKDGYSMATILGNHVPANSAQGTRFINVGFEPVTAGIIMSLSASQWGAQFIGCEFRAAGTLVATQAILSTACAHVQIIDCDFIGAFTGDVIDIAAGHASGFKILENRIVGGANDGIVVSGVATITGSRRGLIARNIIDVAAKTIDTRATSVFSVVDNILISANAIGATSYVIDLTFAAKNILTGNDVSVGIPSWTTVA
jgi:hypothetical protein